MCVCVVGGGGRGVCLVCVCVPVLRHAEKNEEKPYVDSDTPPCVHSKRPRVCRHHAHMLMYMLLKKTLWNTYLP